MLSQSTVLLRRTLEDGGPHTNYCVFKGVDAGSAPTEPSGSNSPTASLCVWPTQRVRLWLDQTIAQLPTVPFLPAAKRLLGPHLRPRLTLPVLHRHQCPSLRHIRILDRHLRRRSSLHHNRYWNRLLGLHRKRRLNRLFNQ